MRRFFTLLLLVFLCIHFTAFGESTILLVQKKLKSLGVYHGPLDGLIGSQTNAAIRRYQIKHGLTITGELSEETLHSLKIKILTKSLPNK